MGLSRIISEHKEYIESSTKNDITPLEVGGEVIISEDYELKGAKMTLKIWKPSSEQVNNGPSVTLKSHGAPQVPFINVVCGTKSGIVLLENPVGFNKMTSWQQVNEEISGLFESPLKPSEQSLANYSRDVLNATFGVPVDKINGTPINE